MDDHDWLAERFEENRARLRAAAYRMLGSLSGADDAVREAWLRFGRSDTGGVENLGGWLTTVFARVCRARCSPRWVGLVPAAVRPERNGLPDGHAVRWPVREDAERYEITQKREARETAPSKDRDFGLRRRLPRSDRRIEERARGPGR